MQNPFEPINTRLTNLEALSLETLQLLRGHKATSPSTIEPDEPLTPDEVAKLFKTSKVTIWSWEKKGLLKGYHLGNKKYYLRSESMAALTKKGGEL
ncbi:helix-turn-helix domain-containing protein [Spirosoma panaciterrae]|uniref:helix-turn-helix domain-containing protein n=1 Tax=Spirosoma panaciterrae TaxID=496058 RepID=UPI00036F1C52|nr:helix-turn-helix domain-containing protein [Spirosoma panaciterrae]